MRSNQSHDIMTRMLFPGLDPRVVARVNRRIDHPTGSDVMVGRTRKQLMGNQGFLPGMWKGGHRQYNHDIFSMMSAAYQEAGIQGVQAGMAHIVEDVMSDSLTRTLGQEGAALFEAAWLYAMRQRR